MSTNLAFLSPGVVPTHVPRRSRFALRCPLLRLCCFAQEGEQSRPREEFRLDFKNRDAEPPAKTTKLGLERLTQRLRA